MRDFWYNTVIDHLGPERLSGVFVLSKAAMNVPYLENRLCAKAKKPYLKTNKQSNRL